MTRRRAGNASMKIPFVSGLKTAGEKFLVRAPRPRRGGIPRAPHFYSAECRARRKGNPRPPYP